MPRLILFFLWLLPALSQTAPVLGVNNAALTFNYTIGTAKLPAAQTIAVRSTPAGVAFGVTTTGPAPHQGAWLLISVSSGRAPQTINAQVNPTGLPAGTYTATVTMTGTTGSPPPTVNVNVTLIVAPPPPTLAVSPASLSFTYITGEPIAGNVALTSNFVLSSTGAATGATVSVTGGTWLKVNPTGNITLAGLLNMISATVDPTGLVPKVYTASIKIESKAAANPLLTLAVTLTVQAARPQVRTTWPGGVGQLSPQSIVTLSGSNFFSTSTAAVAGFTSGATVSVTDGTNTGTETFYIPVYAPTTTYLRVASGSPLPGGVIGIAYAPVTLSAAGGTGPYNWNALGTLPAGLSLASGVISGTPTSAGTYFFTVEVIDSALPFPARAQMPVKLTVLPNTATVAPRILGPSGLLPAGILGTAYPSTLSIQVSGGGGSQTFSVTGLPPGLALNSTTGVFSGTPTSVGTTGNLAATLVSESALLATVPATFLASPGILRITVTTPTPGGGVSNEGQLLIFGSQPQITAVVNSGSFQQGTISPGEIITIFGLGLGPAALSLFDPTVPAPQIPAAWPATTPNTTVTVNGTPAPILYTSANQVSAIVPYGISGATADVALSYAGVASQPVTLTLAATNPGVFTVDASGRGQAAVLNFNATTNDYTMNSGANAAVRGQTVVLYVTGIGATTSASANTLIPASPPVTPTASPTVTIGGQAASVLGAVSPVGSVPGLLQLNVTVPANAPTGAAVPIIVSIGGIDSQTNVTMAIR
ncbi:MAG: putative Ig domain-containing protein [Bryobacteraceae bacterium]|nr:putative Ig domain-containing protein [Bryobacteraceae bacterium]